jgi:thioredoxin 1
VNKNLLIGAVVVAAAVAVLVLRPAPASSAAPRATASQAATARLPRLVDLGAKKCVPCKAMMPVLDGLKADYAGKLEVEFIDIWENREAGEAWRVAIMPTQVFISADGQELARHEGFISREDILARWAQLGVRL